MSEKTSNHLGGQANTEPNPVQSEDESSDFVTRDELNKILNSAISARTKSLSGQLEEIKGLIAKSQPPTETKEETKPSRTAQLEQTVAEMKASQAALIKERDSERQARKDKELRDQTRDHLSKLGVPPHHLKAVMAALISEDRVIAYNDDDQIVFKNGNGDGIDSDLQTGLKSWSKSEEGKAFISPKGAAGSGDKSYRSTATFKPSSQLTDSELALLLDQAHND